MSITTVLVVEDYDAARKALCFIVSSYGPTAIGAGDGEQALVQAAARRPDLIFCDIRMPGMDGIEFLKRLRVIPGLLDVPVIAMSGLGTEAELARIHAAGFAAHLMKPVTPSLIGALLERFEPGISTR